VPITVRESGALHDDALRTAHARLEALARRFPAQAAAYPAAQRTHDDALMRRAWAGALAGVGDPRAPRRDEPLRVVTQRSVPCDGVSEAGPSGAQVAALFAHFADVQLVQLDDLVHAAGDFAAADGRRTVLVSNHRDRYTAASHRWRPDLHLALWNPFQVLDIAAPAVVSWGHAEGALDGLRAWLEGRAGLPGRAPVRLMLPPGDGR